MSRLMDVLSIGAQVMFGILAVGGAVYYLLAGIAANVLRRRRAEWSRADIALPPLSLFKPLRGAEAGLADYIATFFTQDYPDYEILFAVHSASDPAIAVVREVAARFPSVRSRLLVTDEPRFPNPKVYSLARMADAATHDIFVITDSDTSVDRMYLRSIAAAFSAPEVGAMTSLYRGGLGGDVWSRLESLGMSTEFMAGVVMAQWLGEMDFALGPSMAIRRDCLAAIGGFPAMADYLADDFVLGNWAAAKGYKVVLSPFPVEHHATAYGFSTSFAHRLRWNRSTRFSRPVGYFGQAFTYGLMWAALWCALFPNVVSATVLAVTAGIRIALALVLGVGLLGDRAVPGRLWLLPLQDALSFASWIGGFTGTGIVWRSRRYRILSGGRFVPVEEELAAANSE